ncbi:MULTISPECIES: hypothetical protein [Streptomyces]|uniref:Transporter n=1 Tax=Streptomyces griseocarneus TaxID=51201 RepID=A0ABX7RQ05_9ACTN|nr:MULTISPECIES: hypothetical protein [Streptomyces]QSY50342.1 hypothetical protein J3S04_04825 [Streptomyces griseocarneus]
MALALIQMKFAVLRRDLSGPRATWVFSGAVAGLAMAASTIAMATVDAPDLGTVRDLLAVLFALWTLGWMLGPVATGQPVLRAEQFALQPIPRRRLALGLLGAGFVAVTAVVSLVAFAALLVFGLRLGTVPALVSVPALLLQLTLAVLLSRLMGRLFGALARSRVGAVLGAVLTATMLVVASSGWIVFSALDAVLRTGFSPVFSTVVRALPSGWGAVAVEASARQDWLMTGLPLAGLVLLPAVLWVAWNRSLGPARWSRPTVRGSSADRAAPRGRASLSPTGAVYAKELRTYARDPQRLQSLIVPPVFAVLSALVPLAFGSTVFLPFMGALTALMGAATCANLYGQDGTALWLTLQTPGSERADVRGRQLAWIVVFAPLSLLLTAAGIAVAGQPDLNPWALTATFALLGGGAGMVPLVGIAQLTPGPDPRAAKNAAADHSDVAGQAFSMLFLALTTAVPALCVTLAGHLLHNPSLLWAGAPVGVVTGWVAYAMLGQAAHRNLRKRGPELLFLMRTGKQQQQPKPGQAGASFSKTLPVHRQCLLWISFLAGCIALFPQALVPTLMKLSGHVEPLWFLALHMRPEWQWPTVFLMYTIGVLAFTVAARIAFIAIKAARAA